MLPYQPAARRGTPGHPLYVPPSTGASRADNPGRYDTFYAGDAPAGAVAEAFGWLPEWSALMMRGRPALPGSVQALVHYELDPGKAICDLDDARRLVELGLRPSQVVTRFRNVTQDWALTLFERGDFAGVRWWSYYDPQWGSYGLWDLSGLTVTSVVLLSVEHQAVREAAEVLIRPIR